MRGLLKIPTDATLQYSNAGIIFTATKGSNLWQTPPVWRKERYSKVKEKTAKEIKISESQKKVFIDKKTNAHIISIKKFDKDTDVIVEPIATIDPYSKEEVVHPHVGLVTLFEKEKKGDEERRELGRGIKNTGLGYMFYKDLKPKEDKYKKSEADIFPDGTLPNTAQVKQTVLGNCFLLATVMSILKQDEGIDFFHHMMRQTGDGHVVVRLFDPRTKTDTDVKPIYMKVPNSLYYIKDTNQVSHAATWLHMLEKAYAGCGFAVNERGEIIQKGTSLYTAYGSGGQSYLAFKILTNEKAEWIQIPNKISFTDVYGIDLLRPYATCLSMLEQVADDEDAKKMMQERLAAMENDIKNNKFLASLGPDKVKILSQHIAEQSPDLGEYEKMVPATQKNLMDFIDLVTKNYSKSTVNDDMRAIKSAMAQYALAGVEEVKINTFAPNKYDGKYTAQELKIFNQIKTTFEASGLITANTQEKFEPAVPGLLTHHSYSVVNAIEKTLPDGKNIKLLTVRNPWGDTGRCYHWDKMGTANFITEDKHIAEFTVELKDFCQYFNSYTCCPRPHIFDQLYEKTAAITPHDDKGKGKESDDNSSRRKNKPK